MRIRVFVLLASIVIGNTLRAADSNPEHCIQFKSASVRVPSLEITETEWVASGADPSGSTPAYLPGYCRVKGMLNRRTGVNGVEYAIRFALALPEAWSRDFLMQGGGALNGTVPPPLGALATGDKPALARGFAVVTTDTGHAGKGPFDASFFQDQQASLDFSYEAIGKVAETAKQLIAQYYGQDPAFSYFAGCSTGGREAMIMTQRYPSYFNGVISGAPAMRTGFSNLADRWAAVSLNSVAPKNAAGEPVKGSGLSDSDKKLITDRLLRQCDARDGIADGIISDVTGCDFNPAVLTCQGVKTDACLTEAQVKAVERAFAGPIDSQGIQVYPGFFYDTGIGTKKGIPGLLNAASGPVGPPNGSTHIDLDAEERTAANALTDSVYTNLSTFSGHGGKLIFFHGVSDPWFSARDTVEYYNRLAQENHGTGKVADWSRLFLVPGMGHCGGGEAALDNFDMLTAIVDWVEKQQAPAHVIARGKAFPGRSRPLCPYPEHAAYRGSGNPESVGSFSCQP